MVNLFTRAQALAIQGTFAEAMRKVIIDSKTGRSAWEVVVGSRQYERSEGTLSDSATEAQEVIIQRRSWWIRTAILK
jgi:hypothetical protein